MTHRSFALPVSQRISKNFLKPAYIGLHQTLLSIKVQNPTSL
jgi:hypothetical protein